MLHSLTGGGHVAAARAIREALGERAPDVEVELIDGLAKGTGWPFRRSPDIYARLMLQARWIWALLYHATNGPKRARWFIDAASLWSRRRMRRLLRENEADLIVSTHPLLTRLVRQQMRREGIQVPMAVVVTDLVTGNYTWYDRGVDRLFVPSPEVRDRLARDGYPMDRVVFAGQPVHPRCALAVHERESLRDRFGWTGDVTLLVGGGDGVGNIAAHARALDRLSDPTHRLVVVCGRNEALRAELAAASWTHPTDILGFVDNLHEMMAAADLLVTKGGPGTIIEGCVAGLPILIFDYLPGQEIGNVRFVEDRDLGGLARSPDELARRAREILADPARRARIREEGMAAGHPDSAHVIADGLLEMLGHAPTPSAR